MKEVPGEPVPRRADSPVLDAGPAFGQHSCIGARGSEGPTSPDFSWVMELQLPPFKKMLT